MYVCLYNQKKLRKCVIKKKEEEKECQKSNKFNRKNSARKFLHNYHQNQPQRESKNKNKNKK